MNDLSLYENIAPRERNFPVLFAEVPPTPNGHLHWHEHIELLFCPDGNSEIFCAGKTYYPRSDELIVVNCGALHRANGRRKYCLRLHPSFFADVNFDSVLFLEHIPPDETVKSCFKALYDEFSQKRPGYDLAMKAYAYHLICHLIRHYKAADLSESDALQRKSKTHIIGEVLSFIAENSNQKLTTAQIAQAFHFSESYFCTLFKSQTGLSPLRYLNNFRSQKAAVLLKSTALPITEIAQAVGFDDPCYFARVFKQHFSSTPQAFRKQP